MTLNIEPNLRDFDAFYASLIDAHGGLSDAESAEFNARLVERLAARIADAAVVSEAEQRASAGDSEPTMRDAKLVLLMSNHIGDLEWLLHTLKTVRTDFTSHE